MPFAVLGSNVEVEKEIQVLREQLGSSEEDCETGLYKELSDAAKAYQIASGDCSKLKKNLEEKLKHKALDRKVGIKYQSSVYGEQNYTIAKLENELKKVTPQHRLLDVQVDELKTSLKEEFKPIPSMAEAPFLSFKKVNERIKGIVERPIMPSGKIEELVHNAIANKWVEEGCKLHRGKKTCLFCGGPITEYRWAELESHYDEATKELRKESERAVAWIEAQIQAVKELYRISPDNYYRQFRGEAEKINRDMDILRERFISVLDSILQQVKKKVEDIHSTPTYIDHTFDLSLLDVIYKRIKDLESEAVKYGDNLKQNQSKAREKLRLSEVARFKEEIGYAELVNDISMKEAAVREAERLKKEKEAAIRDKKNEIKAKERLRLNEEEGAVKVNAILQNYFGHRFIAGQPHQNLADRSKSRR